MRRGWTLPEMLIALTVTSVIVALASAASVGQMRLYRGIGDVAASRTQVQQAALIIAGALRDLPNRDHILVAMDSAIEVESMTGMSLTCRGDTGRVVVARPAASGYTLATFADVPAPGDGVEILAVDSTVGSLRARVSESPVVSDCARFPGMTAWSIRLVEPFVTGAGMPVRFTRRQRFSAYRASDGLWYLGFKEWNATLARFNTIQPVAGPLLPLGSAPRGLTLVYRDASGTALAVADRSRIAIITVTARSETDRPVRIPGLRTSDRGSHRDSATISVAVR